MALKFKESGDGNKGTNELNFLGEGTFLEGTIETKGSIRIDGKVKGALRANDTLTIGANGVVSGEIHARMAVVGGKIEGNIRVDEKLVLESKSTLIGNLKAKKLVIDEGAFFQGKSDMGIDSKAGKSGSTFSFPQEQQSQTKSTGESKGEEKDATNQAEKSK